MYVGGLGNNGSAPGWVKLVRQGSLFSAYTSPDGSTWTLNGTSTIAMPATVYVGLAVGSKTTTALATGTFSDVTVGAPTSANKPPTVTITAPAGGATYTAPASMSIAATAGDTDGSIASVAFYAGSTLLSTDT